MFLSQDLSFWEKSTYFDKIDFTVIGSGIVGLSAAITYREKFPKAKVVVVERGVFPTGASTKNAGFACFGSVSELLEDYEIMGANTLLKLVAKRWNGLQRLRARCGDHYLDFQSFGGYELFLEKNDFWEKCVDFIPRINEKLTPILGVPNTFQVVDNPAAFGFGKVQAMIFNRFEGQINPAKMMERLRFIANSLGIQILTGITVSQLDDRADFVALKLQKGPEIKSKKVLVATNGMTKRLLPEVDLQPARNQVIITKPIPELPLKGTFHFDNGYYYFRNFENRILLGGARNMAKLEETTDEFGLTPLIQNTLETFLKEVILPNQSYEIDHRWSGIMGVGAKKSPLIQKHSPNIGIAVRMGGMGVAIGSLVGEEGAQLFYK